MKAEQIGRVNRWLVAATTGLSVAVIALTTTLIVQGSSEQPAASPTMVAQPDHRSAVASEMPEPLLTGFDRTGPRLVGHVDGGIRAFRDGNANHFLCGGYHCSGNMFR